MLGSHKQNNYMICFSHRQRYGTANRPINHPQKSLQTSTEQDTSILQPLRFACLVHPYKTQAGALYVLGTGCKYELQQELQKEWKLQTNLLMQFQVE